MRERIATVRNGMADSGAFKGKVPPASVVEETPPAPAPVLNAPRGMPRLTGMNALVDKASLNEWSEGHYLEPDTRFGLGWFEAVRAGRND